MSSVDLTKENLSKYDLILLSTDHTYYKENAQFIFENAKLIFDTRNLFAGLGGNQSKLYKA